MSIIFSLFLSSLFFFPTLHTKNETVNLLCNILFEKIYFYPIKFPFLTVLRLHLESVWIFRERECCSASFTFDTQWFPWKIISHQNYSLEEKEPSLGGIMAVMMMTSAFCFPTQNLQKSNFCLLLPHWIFLPFSFLLIHSNFLLETE